MPRVPAGSRFLFIDLFRGLAVFVMIETHVVNALLITPLKDEAFFKVLTFVNGLVAPSFLFCAGFALAITFQRKWTDFRQMKYPLWRYIVRLLFILVVAYSLHMPFFSLKRLRELADQNAWLPFFQSDILQVIAVTLFVLVVLALLLRDQNIFMKVTAILILVLIFISPMIREMDYSNSSVWLRPYLTMQFKSQFPLFPWAAFLASGTIIGYLFLKAKAAKGEIRFIRQLGYGALLGIILSLVVEYQPMTFYPNHDFWRASPEFFFVRLGIVCLIAVGLWQYEQRRGASTRSVLGVFGQESLLVYVVHLLVVYGYTYEWSFIRMFGPTRSYLQCVELFLALTAAMYVMAYVWHWMKGKDARMAKVVQFVVLATIVVVFIVKPD
ncbi:MAG: DUF1624 domain-containing protein [Ignavibacteriae bacterium]|nr:DUF1624 domain-containing protein [Ignavibacteriota bacterium]